MSIIDDFDDIARRMNRKSEKAVAVTENMESPASHIAAIRTLLRLGYTYTPGAQEWKPPLGDPPWTEARQAAFRNLRKWAFAKSEQGQAANLAGQYTRMKLTP